MRSFTLHRDFVWLLTMRWGGGAVLRLSSRPVVVEDGARRYQYLGGLPALRWEDEADLGGIAVGNRQVALDVRVNAPHQRALVQALVGREAELAMWWPSQSFRARQLVHVGRVTDARWAEGDSLSLTISENTWDDQTLLPDPLMVATAEDWPDAASSAIGKYFPMVIGHPGRLTKGGVRYVRAGSPTLQIDTTIGLLAIAGHAVAATEVTVYDVTANATGVYPVEYRIVGNNPRKGGRQIAVVQLVVDTPSLTYDSTHEYFICWDQGAAWGAWFDQRPMHGLGDVLYYLLGRTSVSLDHAAWNAWRTRMNAYHVDFYWNQPITVWNLISHAILPTVPDISLASGPLGVRPIVWGRYWGSLQPHVRLVRGRNATRASGVESAGVERVNDLGVRWAYAAHTELYQGEIFSTPTPTQGDGRLFHPAAVLPRGAAVREDVIDLDWTWDRATAALAWARTLDLRGRDWWRAVYDVRPDLPALEPGDRVLLTDEDRGLSERRATVQAVRWERNRQQITLIYPDTSW